MQSLWIRFLIASILFACLNACGLKGNLYIPEKQYPQPSKQKDPS